MTRTEVLETAKRLVSGDRHIQHGDAAQNYALVAKVWGAMLGVPLNARQVTMLMAALKVCRGWQAPANKDNYIDTAGYAALAGEMADSA